MIFLSKWFDFSAYLENLKEEFSVINFEPSRAGDMLSKMGIGMLVIFVIIGIIILATVAIQKIFSGKKEK
ncbi:MAG: hypothetical protein E7562_01775 [Ruminococcaceae bacterium]|nr:hypothetical protein [Oscillospiraceae bacterium]